VDQFLRSLAAQTVRDFELVVVDQNSDNRLEGILEKYAGAFPILRLKCGRGHSRAFNLGLAHTTGEIIAFPDDDCWYDPDVLHRAARVLRDHPEWSGVMGREIVQPGFTCGGRWDSEHGAVTRSNIWRRAITFTMFLRHRVAQAHAFDETLGVGAGTSWGAGEETDYLLRILQDGHQLLYDPSLAIWHQGRSGPYTKEVYSKARAYGRGMGRVLRKHRYPLWSVANHLIRPVGGALQSLASGRPRKARYHWSIFTGRLGGWIWTPRSSRQRQAAGLVSSSEDLS
jgi:glycosyltransferase involved in cell wall biosynthesis